jgi:CheY-like chemotaxis protein
MLIDDEEIFNILHEEIIKEHEPGAEVISFFDSSAALKNLRDVIAKGEKLPDFIFVDIRMPVLDGFQLLDALMKFPREQFTGVSIFVVTSSLNQRDRHHAFSYPIVTDYIIKMISLSTLEEIIPKSS